MSRKITPREEKPSVESQKRYAIERLKAKKASVFETIHELDRVASIGASRRKAEGVVYTPESIAKGMVKLARARPGQRVWEPSCGRGVFVFALAERWVELTGSAQSAHDHLAQDLSLSELDASALDDLSLLWEVWWRQLGVQSVKRPRMRAADALFEGFGDERFDLVIGNPPYVRFQNVESRLRERLRSSFKSCAHGNVDLYHAFVEKGLDQSRKLCFIMPSGWMETRSGEALRELIKPRLERLVDFEERLPFDPVRAYVCVALAAEPKPSDPIMWRLGDDLDPEGEWIRLRRDDPRLGKGAWQARASAAPAAAGSVRLGDLAAIRSGIATLADSAFEIKGFKLVGGKVTFKDEISGKDLAIDEGLCPRRVKLTKVSAQEGIRSAQTRILCPYGEDGKLIDEDRLGQEHPDALVFLKARKSRLGRRDKGDQKGYEGWHAYGRKQGLAALRQGEALALSLMSNGELKPFKIDTRETGRFLFTSGFIIEPKPGVEVERLKAALESPSVWEQVMARGKVWAGPPGSQWRSIGAKTLADIRLPWSSPMRPAEGSSDA